MQLSQLEKAVAASVALSWRPPTSRGANDECRPWAMDPHTPPRRLLAIATSTDGILNESVSRPVKRQFVCGRPERKGSGRCRGSRRSGRSRKCRLEQRQTNERVVKSGGEKVEIKPSLAYAVASRTPSLCVISIKEDLARSGGAGAR